MSGGYFDYNQYRLHDIANEILRVIENNDKDTWDNIPGTHYSSNTLKNFQETTETLNRAETMVERIDYLLSGDDSEDSFHEQWKKELKM
mgnify:FL=1